MSDFDYKNYAVRQFRMWAIIFGAWTTVIIMGLIARYGNIVDRNTAEDLVFIGLSAGVIFIIGLYASFVAWVEKKLFQHKKKIDDDSS